VRSIEYGPRRRLDAVIIEPDPEPRFAELERAAPASLRKLSRGAALGMLERSGAFVTIRERPFDCLPRPECPPKSIFVNAMNTEPHGIDQPFLLRERLADLEAGIALLGRCTAGPCYLCLPGPDPDLLLATLEHVEVRSFSGPHPAGLSGTHIHFLDPVHPGETVWHLSALDCADLGAALLTGKVPRKTVTAVSGPGIVEPCYLRHVPGADLSSLLEGRLRPGDYRLVHGTVLFGRELSFGGHLGGRAFNLQAIPRTPSRRFLGWLRPPDDHADTALKGARRPMVWTEYYDAVTPLDLYTAPLAKAILAGDFETALRLGFLETSEEDFALATYVCPSKIDFTEIVRRGIETYLREERGVSIS
jgi:Na+-transporting NADH:ubiquinone oxidoreductase subunit A